jgi:hypothetical protein
MRASVSFGSAGLLLAILAVLWFPYGFFLFPIAGLSASLLIHRGTQSRGQRLTASAISAMSFAVTGFTVCFSLISLQALVQPGWGAFAWGLGFGLAGLLAGRSLCRLWRRVDQHSVNVRFAASIAGISFAISGAIAGFLAFLLFPAWNVVGLAAGVWLAFLLGGFLCDAGWQLSIRRGV